MSKKIQAYFKTENEAQDVQIRLHTYNVKKLEMGEISDNVGDGIPLIIPYVAGTSTTTPAGTGAFASGDSVSAADSGVIGPFIALDQIRHEGNPEIARDRERQRFNEKENDDRGRLDDFYIGDRRELRYIVSGEVKDSEYEDVVSIIRHNGGHIEVMD